MIRVFADDTEVALPLKVPNKNCSRRHFNFLFLSLKENKTWFFMWILCLAEDSLETSSLIFSEKQWKNIYECRLLQSWLALSGFKPLATLDVQSEDWSDWADTQAGRSLHIVYMPFYWLCHGSIWIYLLGVPALLTRETIFDKGDNFNRIVYPPRVGKRAPVESLLHRFDSWHFNIYEREKYHARLIWALKKAEILDIFILTSI